MNAVRSSWRWFLDRWRGASIGARVALAIVLPVAVVVVAGVALPHEAISRLDRSNRLPRAARWGISTVLFLFVVGVIATVSADDPGVATPNPQATPSASASGLPPPTASRDGRPATPSPESAQAVFSGQLADADGDLLRADGLGARGPAYMDIIQAAGTLDTQTLELRLELGGTPPVADPVENEISYGFYVDLDGDGEPEFQTLVSNIEGDGQFVASLTPVSAGVFGDAALLDFLTVGDDAVEVRIPVDAMGGQPSSVGVAAFSEWTLYGDPGDPEFDQVIDAAPDVIWPEEGAEWLALR